MIGIPGICRINGIEKYRGAVIETGNNMKNKHAPYLIFIMFFLAVIYAVPLVQGVIEYRKNKTVQAFDIVLDAAVTPFKRQARLHRLAQKQFQCVDTLYNEMQKSRATVPEGGGFPERLSDAEALCADMKKTLCSVNRYVALDSTGRQVKTLDTVSAMLGGLAPGDSGSLEKLRRITGMLRDEYRLPGLFEATVIGVNNLKYIFWNDRYLRPFEKELENSSVFVGQARPLLQHAWYVLFKDLGTKGIRGLGDWYFYTLDVDYLVKPSVLDKRSISVDPNDRQLTDDPVAAITAFNKRLAARGIDLLVVVVPGKPSIYPDVLSKRIGSGSAAAFSHSNAIIRELEHRGVNAVDLFGPFAKERALDGQAGDSMYLRQDTHWKARGVRCAAKVVAQRIKSFPRYRQGTAEYAIDSTIVDRVGDVAIMSSLALLGKPGASRELTAEKTKCYRVYRVFRDSLGNEAGRELYKDDFRSSEILILGDSFSRIYQTDEPRGAGWISHLALELSQPVASVVNDGGASTLARRSLARRINLLKGKKLVVWEIVERDFRFGEDGWKDVEL